MAEIKRGLIHVKPQRLDLMAGGKRRLGSLPLTDGHWGPWLPPPKDQQVNGVEVFDCVSHGTLKAVEILQNHEFGVKNDYSQRFLARMTGTQIYRGNDPGTVAQFLKNKGCTLEQDWTQKNILTFEQFYSAIPWNVQLLALNFCDEFNFGHQWITDVSQRNLMEQLKYSPLGVGVHAWQYDTEREVYVDPDKIPAEHYVVLYDYVPNYYWLVFDSYSQEIKRLDWNYPFEMVKGYTIHRQIVDERFWVKFLVGIRALLGL